MKDAICFSYWIRPNSASIILTLQTSITDAGILMCFQNKAIVTSIVWYRISITGYITIFAEICKQTSGLSQVL